MESASSQEDSFLRLVHVVTSSCVPMALKAALKLQVMDILARQEEGNYLSASQIAAHFPLALTTSLATAAASLDRILRLLASHGLLSCSPLYTSPQGRPSLTYALNSISRLLTHHGSTTTACTTTTTTTNNNNNNNNNNATKNKKKKQKEIINDDDHHKIGDNDANQNDDYSEHHLKNVDDDDNSSNTIKDDDSNFININYHHLHCNDIKDITNTSRKDTSESDSSLLSNEVEVSHAPFVLLVQDPIFMQTFYNLHEAILDNVVPFTKLYGTPCFSYTEHDQRFNKLLNLGMVAHTQHFMNSLLQVYTGFNGITSLVDVGGGIGVCLNMITSHHPHICGINFDLPHVVANAPKYRGVKHMGGNMFEAIPKAQAIFMKWILHDWSDAHCLKILQRCYEALSNEGKLIIVDALLPSEVECRLDAQVGYQLDVLMLAYNEGGKERTKTELQDLTMVVGFIKLQVVHSVHGCGIVQGLDLANKGSQSLAISWSLVRK
ncbi:hypothetical protein L7F22_021012 [Adiantum nelumboides]|nr:hypothetical protein [Adiantum nelumboides]